MENYQSVVDALDGLKEQGYENDFATQSVCLYCSDLDLRLNPEEFHVDGVYRFEGDSNPDDNSVVYAISSAHGVKGTLVDSYGPYAENLSFEMAQKLKTGAQQV